MQKSTEGKLERSAGILMHITSLPGPAYIGDIGPAAARFADFLQESGQSVWQLLPVQPAVQEQGFSPYSSSSAFAGNPLIISLELLVRDGLLRPGDITRTASTARVDYKRALIYKEKLLRKAWLKWKTTASKIERTAFVEFCAKEHEWLEDYSLYNLYKLLNKSAPWYEWPAAFRDRDEQTAAKSKEKYSDELDYTRWVQMIFDRQWKSLHDLCNSMQIQLLGDVPIYVAHDSADVWSNRELFTLDDQGKMTGVAGVPPDLFNDEGQLWGMPLFDWDRLKQTNYAWWVKRLRKNIAWFDVVRLDHFRGFSSYWSVPASHKSAKGGMWIPGPGEHFFETVERELGSLPFVAEDLGEIDQPVYQLRDKFQLPGMNVLHFAFGDDMPKSTYLPHNHIANSVVYTGTHDNNTSVGWLKDVGKIEKQNLSAYTGTKITTANIADQFIRLAYMSVANLAIIPMQDVLSLGGEARMNMPASVSGNWSWRLQKKLLTPGVSTKLKGLAQTFARLT
jgi:4-alpha-glucanotransferase